jgi:hypothetical protein
VVPPPSVLCDAVLLSGWHARRHVDRCFSDSLLDWVHRSSRATAMCSERLRMSETRLSNKDGVMLTSEQADIAGAASNAVLPAPDADWSAVSLLNQVPSTHRCTAVWCRGWCSMSLCIALDCGMSLFSSWFQGVADDNILVSVAADGLDSSRVCWWSAACAH